MNRLPRPAGYHWDLKHPVERPDGLRPCRWCKGPVQPPCRNWCGAVECVEQWKLRTQPQFLREILYRRDKGLCAACGIDTRNFEASRLRHQLYLVDQAAHYASQGSPDAWRTWKKNYIPETDPQGQLYPREHWLQLISDASVWRARHKLIARTAWEADHIVEIADGGDPFDLANLQTLCVPCHREKTKRSAAHRASRRTKDQVPKTAKRRSSRRPEMTRQASEATDDFIGGDE